MGNIESNETSPVEVEMEVEYFSEKKISPSQMEKIKDILDNVREIADEPITADILQKFHSYNKFPLVNEITFPLILIKYTHILLSLLL